METTAHPLVVVMGVTGCGKSTVGEALSVRTGIKFRDGDEFHPRANVEKMAAGHPLTDEDRWPWLDIIGTWLADHQTTGGIIGCSALKRVYRDRLRAKAPNTVFLHLAGPMEVSLERVSHRPGHFMPASLVQSQYDTLEDLERDEAGVTVDFTMPVDEIVDEFLSTLDTKDNA